VNKKSKTNKEIKVTLPLEQVKLIDKQIEKIGNNRADVTSRIIMFWLKEKGLLKLGSKKQVKRNKGERKL